MSEDKLMSYIRGETLQELQAALLRISSEIMKSHGDDPQSPALVAGAFAAALDHIGKRVDPYITRTTMLILRRNGWR